MRRPLVPVAALAAFLVALPACGSDEDAGSVARDLDRRTSAAADTAARACGDIRRTIEDVGRDSVRKITDSDALARLYGDAARSVRSAAADLVDPQVRTAAANVVDALESLRRRVAEETGRLPAVRELTEAGADLERACS